MANFTDAMKEMIKEQLCMIATCSGEGLPNIGPKRSGRLYSDNQIIWNENTNKQIIKDIRAGSKVAIAVVDRAKVKGFRFVGTCEIFEEGTKPFADCVEAAPGLKMGKPKLAVVFTCEKIYLLDSGAHAGELIAE
ncbi:pyridoxamine 5'-phosphate oxidase family protein [Amygdalobacter nucleatus]|nr:pyridoxamine 5'-phosphate oxidase family protein [Amygdalobacter nucleatus]MDF0485661.1 pyridoxamine 5'-phosphate oxidase family protein [Amygdalobacter nucleatus]